MTASAVQRSSFEISFDELEVGDQVGGGGFSIVYRGLWLGSQVAVKRWFDPDQGTVMPEFMAEVMTHAGLRHPNVVQFLGACMKAPELALVMEYLPHSLHTVLHQQGVALDCSRVRDLACDMARSLAYLHTRRPPIIHRDLKPANFLLDRAWKVKVCDFGLASNSREQQGAGTPAYMAPEIFTQGPYNESADIYAFGVVLWEMATRRQPFEGLGYQEVRRQVLEGTRPPIDATGCMGFGPIIQKCWSADRHQRPSAKELLQMLKSVKAS